MTIKLDVVGEEKVIAGLAKFPKEIGRYMAQAGQEAYYLVLKVPGIAYPPATAANRPGRYRTTKSGYQARMGYYIRGQGAQVPTRGGGYRNLGNSENLGKQWKATKSAYGVTIANGSSYAKYVHGEDQARVMAGIGWKKLLDAVMEILPRITLVYQAWVDKMIKDLGL